MRIQSLTNRPQTHSIFTFRDSETAVTAPENDDAAEQKTPKKGRHIASAIAIASIATVCGICMVSRGSQKNVNKYLNKFKDYLERKQQLSSIKSKGKSSKFYDYSIRKTNSFLKKSESINNITSLKDILFMKLMYKTEPTKNLHKSITDYFQKLSRKTVLDSYKKTENSFNQMNQIFNELDNYILKNSPDEIVRYNEQDLTKSALVKMAQQHRDNANTLLQAFISEDSLKARDKYIDDVTSSLYSKFWDVSFKDFWSRNNKFKRKEMWQTFIAAEQIKGDKTNLAKGIAIARNALSYTGADKTEMMCNYIKNLDGILPTNDSEGIEIIKKLEWFIRNPEGLKNNREMFLAELEKFKNHKIPVTDKNLAKTQEECKKSNIDLIESLIDDDATGEIQDMLSIYYKIAPFELDKSGALLSVKKAVKSFDESVNLESVEYFDKVRDLKLGSAPTDILTIVFSTITLSLGLGYAKDKDKRLSVMLNSGIPILGGIATALFTATKLVSGGKSLAVGFLSGIILNRLGKIADNVRNRPEKNIATAEQKEEKENKTEESTEIA